MKIDNRFFIIPAMPFAVWIFVSVFWNITVGPIVDERGTAGCSLIFGLIAGAFTTIILFVNRISLGHLTIGRRTNPND